LGLLYGATSATLHGDTPEKDALAKASTIRDMFEYLIVNGARHLEDAAKFQKHITDMASAKG
jgi:hypothetical protein